MWRNSSFCHEGSCVEVDLAPEDWRQSTYCSGGACLQVAYYKSTASSETANCVEVAGCICNEVRVRDSKDKAGPVLVFTHDEWAAFTDGVKAGEFDL